MKNNIYLFIKGTIISLLLFISFIVVAQQPFSEVRLSNDTLLNPRTYKFDVWIRCKAGVGVDSFNLKGFQGGFKQNFANYKSNGNLKVEMVTGSSQFNPIYNQAPSLVLFRPFNSIPSNIQINSSQLLTSGNYIYTANASPANLGWLRVCTVMLTDTVDFLTGSPDIFFNIGGVYSTVVMANYNNPNPTDGSISIDTINKLVNPVFNGPITHYNVTGTGAYLTGTNGSTIGLSGSDPKCAYKLQFNGITEDSTEIKGTGGPIYWYHKTVGSYTVLARKIATYEIDTLMNGSAIVTTSNTIAGPADSINGTIYICTGTNNVTYFTHKITNATTYNWNYSGIGVTLTNINDTTVSLSYASNATSGVLSVYGNNGAGNGTPYYLSIHVSSVAGTAGVISGLTSVCAGQNVIYTVPPIANASAYMWNIPFGCTATNISPNSISIGFGASVSSGYISVSGTSFCGVGSSSVLNITVNPIPAAAGTISGLTSVCLGQSNVVYTVPTINNATTYLWSIPYNSTGSSVTNSIAVSFDPSNQFSGSISVQGYNGCGYGPISTLAVATNPNSVLGGSGGISGISPVCQGQSNVVYTTPTITNATSYIWTLPNGANGTSTTNTITVNYDTTAVSGYVKVSGSNVCGIGVPIAFPVNVYPLPVAAGTISGSSTVCQGQSSVTYTVPTITNAYSYIWNFPNGITGSSTTNSINLNYSANPLSGYINVKGQNGCGNGIASTKLVTVNPLPSAAGTISGPNAVCFGQNNVSYNVTTIPNATSYTWTYPSGISGSSTTNSINLNFGLSAVAGNIAVKGHNTCGDGVQTTIAVALNSMPAAASTISGNTSICTGQTNVIYSTPVIAGANTYSWGLPIGATGSSVSNTITVHYSGFAQSGLLKVSGHSVCGNGNNATLPISVNNCSGNGGSAATNVNVNTFPNPFSTSTNISYTLKGPSSVQINIYDILGNEIQELINTNQEEGMHKVKFNAGELPSGVYFYKIRIGESIYTGKLILTKG